ncbi:hypothetical protein BC939DRAFT_453665 [Gamsiella multidivaricata]|uniref:uncharacterized protein n=1 Tax=Gamsiella multidivaricata TaxID=101098 RepID=UPI0022204708|nr:uncharacterized protein BC939DRAFT_453665 [Gamsiella multidivaricata]KAG0371252.1 hypothetical protein BGZ54_008256 [Gamsiella multidivaricata]KAI7822569.1 hypothetical protein BC939DRAFT_453665 [Gamsiella multidivaricata]
MVTATSSDGASNGQAIMKVKAPSPKAGFRNQSSLVRSQPIVLDLDAFPAPTSPLPIPSLPSSPISAISRASSRTPPAKPSSPMGTISGSLRPPPRPRSIVSHLALSKPPSESLPPVPVILHSNDNLYASSTPTSPTTPTTPSFYSSFSLRNDSSLSTSLPFNNTIRSSSVGRVNDSCMNKPPRKYSSPSGNPAQKDLHRGRAAPISPGSPQARSCPTDTKDEPINRNMAPRTESNEGERRAVTVKDLPARPVGLVATRYYGIESSMRWREGVDPIQKRFASSSGSWRCQDRFAVFFRPGDQIGPDQVVTKTFWSEAWPYPIETILYGTINPFSSSDNATQGLNSYRSDHEGDQVMSRLRTGLRLTSETQLKSAASFPPAAGSKDPRYITSEGVQKIAKVMIPMPDVAIDQMELVKAPIKVELRIFILEAPLRIHASAFLLGRTVAGVTELYA